MQILTKLFSQIYVLSFLGNPGNILIFLCSKTCDLIVSNYISPVGLFYTIFRLTYFSSDPFDSTAYKQVAPSGH